jgi:hypothetical protein
MCLRFRLSKIKRRFSGKAQQLVPAMKDTAGWDFEEEAPVQLTWVGFAIVV